MMTDQVCATAKLATAPTADPINQSGREDTVNVLIDQLDEESLTLLS
jgi:hypothetical protein